MEAIRAGQRSFEHLIGVFEGSSAIEDELLHTAKTPGKFLETYDAKKEASLLHELVARQIWQCPTQYWERIGQLIETVNVESDPDVQYIPARWRTQLWPRWTASLKASNTIRSMCEPRF